MQYYIIFFHILLLTNTSYAMEVIKKKKNKIECIEKSYDHPINKELLFIHTLHKNDVLSKDVTHKIISYCVSIREKDFQHSEIKFVKKWHDFCIPIFYHYLLTPKQMIFMKRLLTSIPYPYRGYSIGEDYQMYYFLESNKDYKQLLSLPVNVRTCLTLKPQSEIYKQQELSLYPIIDLTINTKKKILVKNKKTIIIDCMLHGHREYTNFFGYSKKSILPEEKSKKNYSKKIDMI